MMYNIVLIQHSMTDFWALSSHFNVVHGRVIAGATVFFISFLSHCIKLRRKIIGNEKKKQQRKVAMALKIRRQCRIDSYLCRVTRSYDIDWRVSLVSLECTNSNFIVIFPSTLVWHITVSRQPAKVTANQRQREKNYAVFKTSRDCVAGRRL